MAVNLQIPAEADVFPVAGVKLELPLLVSVRPITRPYRIRARKKRLRRGGIHDESFPSRAGLGQ